VAFDSANFETWSGEIEREIQERATETAAAC